DVIEVVFQLLYGIVVTLAIRIIHLRPSGDSRFDQVPKMIKRNALLIAFGALAPFSARTNQANVPLQGVPKLRQLIEAKFSQPAPHTCHSAIAFARIHVIVRLIRAPAHRPELEKNETFPVAADPFLSE